MLTLNSDPDENSSGCCHCDFSCLVKSFRPSVFTFLEAELRFYQIHIFLNVLLTYNLLYVNLL